MNRDLLRQSLEVAFNETDGAADVLHSRIKALTQETRAASRLEMARDIARWAATLCVAASAAATCAELLESAE